MLRHPFGTPCVSAIQCIASNECQGACAPFPPHVLENFDQTFAYNPRVAHRHIALTLYGLALPWLAGWLAACSMHNNQTKPVNILFKVRPLLLAAVADALAAHLSSTRNIRVCVCVCMYGFTRNPITGTTFSRFVRRPNKQKKIHRRSAISLA